MPIKHRDKLQRHWPIHQDINSFETFIQRHVHVMFSKDPKDRHPQYGLLLIWYRDSPFGRLQCHFPPQDFVIWFKLSIAFGPHPLLQTLWHRRLRKSLISGRNWCFLCHPVQVSFTWCNCLLSPPENYIIARVPGSDESSQFCETFPGVRVTVHCRSFAILDVKYRQPCWRDSYP